jgi:hypothetical protein
VRSRRPQVGGSPSDQRANSRTPTPPLVLGIFVVSILPARAADVDGIAIHGSVSLTESSSNDYNFYGDTSNWHFDNNDREVIVNGGYRFANGISVNAQVYGYDLDNYSELTLDFANASYQFEPWFGVRIGRNKSQEGLYGDAQDLDQVHTFADLPLTFYPRNVRPLSYTDGIEFYGTIDFTKGGSLDYDAYAGNLSPIASDAPIAMAGTGLTTTDTIKLPAVYGLCVLWTTPVEGLHLGYSFAAVSRIEIDGHLSTKAVATMPGLTYSATPVLIDEADGAGTWDREFSGRPGRSIDYLYSHLLSAEYTWGNWDFSAEAKASPTHALTNLPALGVRNFYAASREEDAYVMGTYQMTKKLGLGLYYSYQNSNSLNHTTPKELLLTRDAAGVISYAFESWWLFKVEFHAINGLGMVNSAGDFNPNAPAAGSRWEYLVLKTTFSF